MTDEQWNSLGKPLIDVALESGWFKSRNDFRRQVAQGAVRINNEKISDPTARLVFHNGVLKCLERHQV